MAFDRNRLIDFLNVQMNLDTTEISDEEPLFSAGLVDSFGMVELMTFIEKTSGIRISPGDVTLENFDSVARILAFVDRADGTT